MTILQKNKNLWLYCQLKGYLQFLTLKKERLYYRGKELSAKTAEEILDFLKYEREY